MDRAGPSVTGPGSYCPYSTDSSSSARSYVRPFDTIRALHETIVSLRTALEDSRRENERLQKQINVRSVVDEGRSILKDYNSHTAYGSIPKNLNTSIEAEELPPDRKSKKLKKRRSKPSTEEPQDSKTDTGNQAEDASSATVNDTRDESTNQKPQTRDVQSHQKVSIVPDIQIISHPSSGSGHQAMASRIDVKIKVSSNINVDGSSSEADSSETAKEDVTVREQDVAETPEDEDKTIADDNPDNVTVKEEFIRGDVSNLKVNLTNEENLSVSKSTEGINIRQTSSENLLVDVDRQSNPSISEGDNSVFTEDVTTPVEGEQDGAAGYTTPGPRTSVKKNESENQEEVDDIELIFSSDDNKDMIQEDLVSISDYEPWQETGQAGTPVLIKFKHLSSDQECSQKNSIERSDSEIVDGDESGRGAFPKGQSLESQDSLSVENIKKSLDLSIKSSSLEKDNSVDYGGGEVQRDDSFDVGANSGTSGLGKRWTNYNVLIETDISKCGIAEDNILEMGRRNTCPNPPAYRPIIHTGSRSPAANRSPLAVKFSRSPRTYSPHQYLPPGKTLRTVTTADSGTSAFAVGDDAKRSRAAQTDITALSQQWRSETHLPVTAYGNSLYTLPSKFVPPPATGSRKYSLRIPASFSMTSPGVSQWTVNESSIATQTTQTDAYWADRGDSFDSSKSYSLGSRYSTLSKHHRSRSVPSIRCAICRQSHQSASLRPSESMHYTPRVIFQEPTHKIRGSLPDLRHDCNCPRRYGGPSLYRIHGDSGGSTDSLLEEAEDFLRRSIEGTIMLEDVGVHCEPPLHPPPHAVVGSTKHRRCSENDIQRDYIPSKQALPFLPKTAKCLKPGHLAKVIARNGRVVVGRVRYIGPLAGCSVASGEPDDTYVGLQLPNNLGDCDGSIDGRKFFDCEPQHGIFVPFKKVVMAWNS